MTVELHIMRYGAPKVYKYETEEDAIRAAYADWEHGEASPVRVIREDGTTVEFDQLITLWDEMGLNA